MAPMLVKGIGAVVLYKGNVLACPRRLCQPPWTQLTGTERIQLAGGIKLRRTDQLEPQPLFGRGGLGERRFSQKSGLSPRLPYSFPRTSAAALSAAVDATNWNGAYPTGRGNQVRRNGQLKPQLLFGRGGLGERRFSQRSGLSPQNLRILFLACPRRLCQPPWTQPPGTERTQLAGGTK